MADPVDNEVILVTRRIVQMVDALKRPAPPDRRLRETSLLAEVGVVAEDVRGLFDAMAESAARDAAGGDSRDAIQTAFFCVFMNGFLLGQRSVLPNAIDGMKAMLDYVPEYFRKKWKLDEYLTKATQALAATEPESA